MPLNQLSKENSPYLLQHANNPVHWVAWSNEAFETAKKENKLVLISIGYSACHWCHVMEKECFEDEEVAELMNAHFINIKVDREERPDVDQVYMSAVQLMTQQGGWPLNCITLADGRPIYGGTYFPKQKWMHILRAIVQMVEKEPKKVLDYASNLHLGVQESEQIIEAQELRDLNTEKLHEMCIRWSRNFDTIEGGQTRAPKFPLPNNWLFLMHYGQRFLDSKINTQVALTLNKMCAGGIYDQLGGGFYRYSVDMLWKVPHFEKMLYDNAQLISLYSLGYEAYKNESYKQLVYQTIAWMKNEMMDEKGAFYCAIDADSEGEEGKYYCWKEEELKTILGKEFEWVKDFYSINKQGYWEDEKYILLKTESDERFAQKNGRSQKDFDLQRNKINELLLSARKLRVAPGLDNKCLTSWNALAVIGLCDAYRVFRNDEFLNSARNTLDWILLSQICEDGTLHHVYTNGHSKVDGFLEDYAAVINALIDFYQISQELKYIERAEQLTAIVIRDFQDPNSKMCYFTTEKSTLIARKMELNDNVIPSSNSIMAMNFYRLGQYYRNEDWILDAKQMLLNVYDGMEQYGSSYSNWGILLLTMQTGFIEIVIVDDGTLELKELLDLKRNETLVAYHNKLPIAKDYKEPGIYICYKGTCYAPMKTVASAQLKIIELIEKNRLND